MIIDEAGRKWIRRETGKGKRAADRPGRTVETIMWSGEFSEECEEGGNYEGDVHTTSSFFCW